MKSTFSIKNFRVFDSDGYTFEINPITIITGCNNSGKSSLVKACALYSEWIKTVSVKGVRSLFTEPLRLSNEMLKLGRLDSVINSNNNNDKRIIFTLYSSDLAPEDIEIEYIFIKLKDDITNNAWLSDVKITDSHNRVILEANRQTSQYRLDLLPLKEWACKLHEYEALAHDQYNGGPTPTSSNLSAIGIQLAKECKTLSMYRRRLNSYVRDNYPEHYAQRIRRHAIYLDSDYTRLPLIYNKELKELDNIDKECFLEYLTNEIIKGNLFASNGWPNRDREVSDLIEKIALINRHYQESPFKKFSEYLWYLENDHGLSFSFPINIHNDISGDNLCYFMHDRGTPTLYSRCINMMTELFYGYLGKDIYFASESALNKFLSSAARFITESLLPRDFKEFNYIGTCQLHLKRVFPIDQNVDLFNTVLNEYINSTANIGKSYKRGKFINKRGFFVDQWLQKFSIGSKVIIKQTEEGSGVVIAIKDLYSNVVTNLSDMGYGVAQLLAILFSIESAIFKSHNPRGLRGDSITLSIEEPESHLHPKYQSMLASLFTDAFVNHKIHFVIETHSEYMIRAFQTFRAYGPKYHEYGLSNRDLSIYYFNEPRKELRKPNEEQIKKIEIADDGCLINPFGPGFFDEAINLSTDLLRIKLRKYEKQ